MSSILIRTWLNNNWKHISQYPKRINNYEGDDILQEVIVQFLEMDTGKTYDLIVKGEAQKYIMAMYKVNCFSKTSPYQRTYNKFKTVELNDIHSFEYDEGYDICWRDIELILNNMDVHFLDKIIYKEYITKKLVERGYSINRMSKDSTIPKGTLDLMFKKIRIELKMEMKKIIEKDDQERND